MSYEQLHREHARRSAKERLCLKLTRNRLASIRADILGGRATFLERTTAYPTRAMYLVTICDVTARVVFCHAENAVITVMRRGVTL
jgi:hypothetical protein